MATADARSFQVCDILDVRTKREHLLPMLRLDEPNDNDGRGWVCLSEDQLVGILYIGLKIAKLQYRSGLSARNATKSDEAAKAIAVVLAERLRCYAVFGPAKPQGGHSCGGGGIRGANEAAPVQQQEIVDQA